MEVAIVVDDAFAQVDVASLTVALLIPEGSAEDRDVTVSLKREVDILCRMGEVLTVPEEMTVVVTNVVVEVDLSIVPLAMLCSSFVYSFYPSPSPSLLSPQAWCHLIITTPSSTFIPTLFYSNPILCGRSTST